MARPAPIRLAGTIAATAMCVAAATEATLSQAWAQDPSRVLNNQLQIGDVISGVTLNVEDAEGEVASDNAAQGNSLSGSVENDALNLTSSQETRGDIASISAISLTGDVGGAVNATTQSRGNYLAAGAYGADLSIESSQVAGPSEITAASTVTAPTARLLGGASVGVTAIANTAALGGTGATVEGTVVQGSLAGVRASTFADTRYIPETAEFISQALGNAVSASSTAVSSQALTVRQRQAGNVVAASTSANAANAWDLAGRARATANQAVLHNQGGSVVAVTDQSNLSEIEVSTVVTSFDWGAATANATGVGNEVSIGNNDRYVSIDNAQVNSGGVEVTSSFAGTNGYDAYVAAEAVGNSVTGYACSACDGYLEATNAQTNSGPVSATAATTIRGAGRAVVTGANAIGNAATFYVSKPTH